MFKSKEDPKHAGSSSLEKLSGNVNIIPSSLYKLYFKGLVKSNSIAGIGIAICDEEDNILFEKKGPIFGSDITFLEIELKALNLGLTEAFCLGITHISIYCDYQPIYGLVTGASMPEKNKCGLLMEDLQRIRSMYVSSVPIFVDKTDIKYAYELAMETLVSEIIIDVDFPSKVKPTRKKTCSICLADDISVDQMFSIEKCRHRFCSECVKRHIEVTLLERSLMGCPHYSCNTKLTIEHCVNLLTPKLREMWELRIEEESIPVTDRIYCPNPRCSALMSKPEILNSTTQTEVKRCCFKCSESFCMNCKDPWHENLSCDDYKKLHPDPTENDGKLKALGKEKKWRQCGKCQHMIQRSYGCVLISCRCGHNFCYECGAEDGACTHYQNLTTAPPQLPPPRPPPRPAKWWEIILFWVIFLGVYILIIIFWK